MDNPTILLLILLIVSVWALGALVVWLALRSRTAPSAEIAVLQTEMRALREQLGQSLGSVSQQVRAFGDVQRSLGQMGEATRRIMELGQSIASLQDVLRAPKPRGGLGEVMLSNLLQQVLPTDCYRLQHGFDDGSRVDAAIFLAGHVVPVDAKFPLEAFQRILDAQDERARQAAQRAFVRDVRQRVDETAGYIRPDAGTFEFAMMYVPAENVYYELLCAPELFEYALARHVVPVSPNSFFAYLHVVVFGLRGLQIEENARALMGQLARLDQDFEGCQEAYHTLGSHIGHAQARYSEIDARLSRFGDRLSALSAGQDHDAGTKNPDNAAIH